MSKAVKEKIIAVVFGAVHGVVLLQTILAAVWAFQNFTTIQAFEESRIYLSMAEGMYSDGFRLIGYPLFLRLCMWLGGVMKVPYTIFVYLLQLIIVNALVDKGMAAFLRGIVGRKVSTRHVAAITALAVTNPFVWQMIFAVLPDAFCFGLTFYLLGNMFLWMKKKEADTTIFAIVTFAALLVLSLLERKAFWVSLTSVICFIIIGWIRTARNYGKTKEKPSPARFLVPVAGMIICLSVAVMVNGAIKKNTAAKDSMDYSLEADAMKRFVYPNLADGYIYYSEEFKAQISNETLQKIQSAGLTEYYDTLGPAMVKVWGNQRTVKMCRMLNTESAKYRKTFLLKSVAKDWFAGTFSPFVLAKRTYPFGDSVNPLYLNLMWTKAPTLTLLYMNVGRWGFPVCIILLLAGGILCLPKSGKTRVWMSVKHSIFFACLIAQTALSTLLLSVPEFDFRNCLLPCMLWAVWGMSMIIFEKDEELFFIGKEAKWEKQH